MPTASPAVSPSLAIELVPGSAGQYSLLVPAGWSVVDATGSEAGEVARRLREAQGAATVELLPQGFIAASVEDAVLFDNGVLAHEAASGGIDGALTVVRVDAPEETVQTAQTTLLTILDRMEPVERGQLRAASIELGSAVSASALMASGHTAHLAQVVTGDGGVYAVWFVTKVPAVESEPVFDRILASIATGP